MLVSKKFGIFAGQHCVYQTKLNCGLSTGNLVCNDYFEILYKSSIGKQNIFKVSQKS